MADVALAISAVMRQEDATLSGIVTSDSGGGFTRFGIAEKFYPWVAELGFYTTMPAQQAIGVALTIYLNNFCLPLNIADIPDQAVATKLLSLGLNIGITEVARWLQEAVGSNPDGNIGPATIAALKKADSQKVLDALKQQAVAFYQQLAKDNPADVQYLKGWLNRANA
jgi:lysozyme family protein